jgi:iron complex transport system permease protein
MQNSKSSAYAGYIRHKKFALLIMLLVLLALAVIAVSAGSSGISPLQVILSLLGRGNATSMRIVWAIRMPRIVTAIVGGIGLASVGCVMQGVLKNPLASASTLGVSQGAAFGASLAIIGFGAGMQNQTLDGVTFSNPYLITVLAFVCSMLSTLVVLGLSRFRRVGPESMVLCGVALSALFSGGTSLMQYFADDVKVAAVVFWSFGDLGRASWREVAVMAAVCGLAMVYFTFNRWNYNALQSGETTAKSLGVNANRDRVASMVVCSLTAATVVSFVGIISFIGLIAPHVTRRFIGGDYRYLLPASAIVGACLLLLSDIAARLIISPIILPIGAITSFCGAPMFLYLLFKGLNRHD